MQPKRFSGASVRAVMSDVRDTFGRDALILEQRTVGNSVEMLATIAEPAPTPAERISASLNYEVANAPESLYVRRFRQLGFSEPVLSRLPAQLPDWHTAMASLLRCVPVAERLPASGLLTVTGPAGAGVTSSLIRYAVHLLRSGKDPRRMRFVQLGPSRLGADESLQLAGQTLGVPVSRAPIERVVTELLDDHPETLVLADHCDTGTHEPAVPRLNDPLLPEQELLVIPAHWRAQTVNAWLAARDDAPANRHRIATMVTNLDRCGPWGEWLSLVIERQWPLAMMSRGQKLPDDLCLPKHQWLADQLFDQIDRSVAASKVTAGVQSVDQ